MSRRWTALTMRRVTAVGLAVMIAGAVGCEREQYDPEAVSAGDEETDSGGGSHHYSLEFEGTDVEVGQSGEVAVDVLPSSDLWVNLDFPWSLEIQDAEGLEVATEEFDANEMDLSEEKARIPIELEALQEGQHQVRARGDISVCNDEICHTLRDQEVDFVVDAR